jgi:hypothetical protein
MKDTSVEGIGRLQGSHQPETGQRIHRVFYGLQDTVTTPQFFYL